MGYKVSSLASIPSIDGMLYIFGLGVRWKGSLLEAFDINFDRLSSRLGRSGALIQGHNDGDIENLLVQTIERHWNSACREFDSKVAEELSHIMNEGSQEGGILILFDHPLETCINEKSSFLYAPLKQLESNFGGLDSFLNGLVSYSESRSNEFITKFENHISLKEYPRLLELKPNFFGIGLNLNYLLERG